MVQIIKPEFIFEDERGTIIQLLSKGFKQVNFVSSVPGAKRGDHCHKLNNEGFYVISGKFRLFVTDTVRQEEYTFSKGDMFVIEKGVFHSFEYLENTQLIGFYDQGVELADGKKDIVAK